MQKSHGWRLVQQLGPALAGFALLVVATALDGRFNAGAPILRNHPATAVVWLSILVTATLAVAWYLAARGRPSIKRRRE